jgi:hypothetical protein
MQEKQKARKKDENKIEIKKVSFELKRQQASSFKNTLQTLF